jgi:hypothetical protein
MRRTTITALVVAAVSLALVATAAAGVLVNTPRSNTRCFRAGVWYQHSDGTRRVTVLVRSKGGRTLLRKTLNAPSGAWKYWGFCPVPGRYVVKYTVGGHSASYHVTVRN